MRSEDRRDEPMTIPNSPRGCTGQTPMFSGKDGKFSTRVRSRGLNQRANKKDGIATQTLTEVVLGTSVTCNDTNTNHCNAARYHIH